MRCRHLWSTSVKYVGPLGGRGRHTAWKVKAKVCQRCGIIRPEEKLHWREAAWVKRMNGEAHHRELLQTFEAEFRAMRRGHKKEAP